jgi:hypothetical protein
VKQGDSHKRTVPFIQIKAKQGDSHKRTVPLFPFIHKLFTKQERFWNAVVSFREREVRIVVSTGRQKLPGNIIFKKAEIW